MSDNQYDVIVVGARCAGSPTAMLLAEAGHRVLVVDRASFPSDTLSTHLVHPPGIAALQRWGLLERLVKTGCPPIDTYAFDFGAFKLEGSPGDDEAPVAYGPRRTALDALLVDGAREAGAEVREEFSVDALVFEDDRVVGIRGRHGHGRSVTERAQVVVGADGRFSLVARSVQPEQYHDKPPLLCAYYAYWSDLPMDGRFECYLPPHCGFAAAPTNDDLTLVIAGWSIADCEEKKHDVEGNYLATLRMFPDFADRLSGSRRETRFAGTSVAGYLRKPFGPGWALVGDAGYNKDFITAQGISDAFRDAELCAHALDQALTGSRSFDETMLGYQAARDGRVLPMYEFTSQLATLEPPPPEMQALLSSMAGNQPAMDAFVRMSAGGMSPAEFFSEEHLTRVLTPMT